MQGREDVLGPAHPDALASLRSLAAALKAQSKLEELEAVQVRGRTADTTQNVPETTRSTLKHL